MKLQPPADKQGTLRIRLMTLSQRSSCKGREPRSGFGHQLGNETHSADKGLPMSQVEGASNLAHVVHRMAIPGRGGNARYGRLFGEHLCI